MRGYGLLYGENGLWECELHNVIYKLNAIFQILLIIFVTRIIKHENGEK